MDYVQPDIFSSNPQTSSAQVLLFTSDDDLTENLESLTVRLVAREGQVVNPNLSEATVLIIDNDGNEI